MDSTNTSAPEYNVHIDLTGSDEYAPKETLIHRQLLCKMTATILNDVQTSVRNIEYRHKYDTKKDKAPQNLNYLVTGVRGSGKSTFLKYLVQCLTKKLDILEKDKDKKHRYSSKCYIGKELSEIPKCELLCQYDPSAPASSKKASFFLTVIAAIKSKVEEQQRTYYAKNPKRDYEFDAIKSKLKKMDKGLSRLSKGEPSMHNMTEYQASKLRLDNDDQDVKLRELLDEVLELLCQICDVHAFIVTIDDADTRSKQCADVMESLRLYVSHPRLVVILAGDKKLYTERIRELHFNEYKLNYHIHDESGFHSRLMSISAHANQYILKLFPSSHQYELRNINTVLSKADPISLVVKYAIEGKVVEEDIKELLRKVFAATISQNPLRISIYIDQFLSLPLRSILEAMDYWTAHTVWYFLRKLELERKYLAQFEEAWNGEATTGKGNTPKPPSPKPNVTSVNVVIEKNNNEQYDGRFSISLNKGNAFANWQDDIREIQLQKKLEAFRQNADAKKKPLEEYEAIHDIYSQINWLERKISWTVQVSLMHILQDEIRSYDSLHESLNVDTPRVYYSVLLKHCQNMDDLEHGFYLSGDMGMRREDKYITLLLAVSFKNLIKNLDDFISYIFFGPASVSLYAKAVEQLRREMEGKTPPEVEEMSRKFDSYLHVGSWDSPTRWARHANMIWCFDAGMEGIHSGILRLRDTKIVEMLHQWVKTQFSSQKEYKNRKKGLAILVSLSRSADRDNSYFISIFSFLAFILKCTHICGKIHAIENDKDDAKKKEELIRTIKEYFLIKSCRSPEWLMRDKVVKTYNTCHENMTSILEAMQNIPCPTDPEKNYCDAFMDKIADEIINWHHGNTNKKGNNNAARVEDIYNNNITPHSMGKFWSDLFYCMKSTSYEAEGFKFENYATNSTSWKPQLLQSQVQLYLEGKSDHLDKFAKLVKKVFEDSFKGEPGRLTAFYLGRIKAFPLTDSFIKACEAFQNYVQFGVTNQPKTRNTNIPLNVFQVIQENTIKKALIRALQLPTPSLPQIAQNTLDKIGIINDFIDKLKQAHNPTTGFNLTTTSNHTIISNPTTTSKSSTIGSGNASATGSSIANGTGNNSSNSIISIPNFTGTSSTTGAINITSAIGNSSSSNTSISNFTGTANITSVTGIGNNSSISNTSIPNFTGTSNVTSGIYTPGFTGFPGATGSVSATGNTI